MKKLLVLAALLVSACGDNITPEEVVDAPRADARIDGMTPIDGAIDGAIDGMVDAPDGMVEMTLTTFVTDQILNHTNGNTDPVAFTTFSTLMDPDATDTDYSAYASLF